MTFLQRGKCAHCGEAVMLLPYAPGIEGPVKRWVHANAPNDPRRHDASGGRRCADGTNEARL